MQTYISLLRGINVSGHKKIKMAELKELFQSLGFGRVRTYIQSGNVVFESAEKNVSALRVAIETAISGSFGFDVKVLVKLPAELEFALNNNPFLLPDGENAKQCSVTFLETEPTSNLVAQLDGLSYPPDEFNLLGDLVYLHCPNGFARTKLTNNLFESKLKMAATTRNWRTVNKLHEMALGHKLF